MVKPARAGTETSWDILEFETLFGPMSGVSSVGLHLNWLIRPQCVQVVMDLHLLNPIWADVRGYMSNTVWSDSNDNKIAKAFMVAIWRRKRTDSNTPFPRNAALLTSHRSQWSGR
jgi:hypothetical protein